MKIKILVIVLCSFIFSCSPSPEEQIQKLNGYWEIETAKLPEGITKEYSVSSIVDYIEVENKKGFRTKVKPEFDGDFKTTGDKELLTVKVEHDSINLYYETPYDSWKESLLSAADDELKIKNKDGIIYTYKKFTPYSSDEEEKQ